MPKLSNGRSPKYRHHKASGQAVVSLSGKDHYLGRHGSPASHAAYARLVSEWEAGQRRPAAPAADVAEEQLPLTIVELADRYLEYAKGYFVKAGRPTSEQAGIRCAIKPLVTLYGMRSARGMKPRHLKAVRQTMVDDGLTRGVVNQHIGRVVRMFRWGTEEELLPNASVYRRLKLVRSLQRGKTKARDNDPVGAVADAVVERTMPWLPPTVRSILTFMRHTGCRPGEAVSLRPCDIDLSSDPPLYVPREHKTEHHGKQRQIFLGPKAMDAIRPLLLRPAEAHVFDPRDSEKKRGRAARVTMRDHYDKNGLARAVARAISAANKAEKAAAVKEEREPDLIPRWTPNQLRHTRATELRRLHGIEAARVALGHSDATLTAEVYAERDEQLAAEAARKTG